MVDLITVRRTHAVVPLLLVVAVTSTFLMPVTLARSKQDKKDQKDKQEKKEAPPPTPKEIEKIEERLAKVKNSNLKLSPAEIVAETCILAYGGRLALKAARSAVIEQGTVKLATDQGDINGTYMLRRVWKDKSWDDLMRTDIELDTPEDLQKQGNPPKTKYVLAYNGASVWAAQNGQYITPSPESVEAFKSQLRHDYTTLLRYREDGSKIELVRQETVVGIETNVIDLTAPDGEKTRFWVSAKTYHILHMAYDLKMPDGTVRKFRVSYYPPRRIIANTLVPARRVLEESGKFVQEIDLNSFTYSTKIDPEVFQHLQE